MQDEDIGSLKKRLNELVKELETSQLERGDTINRLNRSLQQSQQQCKELLETCKWTAADRC